MPIYKYKPFEDAQKALWNLNPDKSYYKRIAELWEFANKLNPIRYPKGLYKFINIKQANRHRETIELEHAKKLRANKSR
jgi:hypothetical protein